jgi:hypothetical protein
MVARRVERGRFFVHAFPVRKVQDDSRRMKDRRSKLLMGLLAELKKPPPPLTKRERAILDAMSDYPFSVREPVFCWLWANHAEVREMRSRLDGPSWEGIAAIMGNDGVAGSRGEPPNANSVRRVWGRVCWEIEEQEARRAREG